MNSLVVPLNRLNSVPQTRFSLRCVALAVLISAAVIVPAFVFGVPSNIDLANHFRFALPFADAVKGGNLYPGWLAESNGGYGDPSFRFYPPALYYLLTLTQSITGSWYSGTLITFLILSVVGGLGIYFWARVFLAAEYAAIASGFYALAPYHINELYQASLLAEFAGCAVLPFVFGFAERLRNTGSRKALAGLGATYALLILTHLPLAVIVSFGLIAYAIVRSHNQSRLQILLRFFSAGILGLAASAVYWTTMVAELRWIGTNQAIPDALVDYSRNFLLSSFSPDNMNVWWMNILALFTVLLFVPIVYLWRTRSKSTNATSLLTGFSLFMTLPLSWPIWRLVTPLQQVQFPWRWLALFSAAGSVLAAAGLSRFQFSNATRATKLLLSGALLVSVVFTMSHSVREARYLNAASLQTFLSSVRGTASVNYWIPVWANPAPRLMIDSVEVGERSLSIRKWDPEVREFSVSAGTNTQARVRTFFYPHWHAVANDKRLKTTADTDGALLIELPKEAVTIDLVFKEPARAQYSAVTTGFAWLLIVVVAVPFKRR